MIRKCKVLWIPMLLTFCFCFPVNASGISTGQEVHPVINEDNLIKVTKEMVFLESSTADPSMLFDEQDNIVISPDGKISGDCTTAWEATSSSNHTSGKMPFKAYVDLGKEYEINATAVFHFSSTTKLTLSYGQPGQWVPFARYELGSYKYWSTQENDVVRTRYIGIQFDIDNGTGNTREISLFGQPTGETGTAYIHPEKIEIKSDMITNVTGHVDHNTQYKGTYASPMQWFDEQDDLSDPPVEIPETYFTLGWQGYRASTIVDIDLRQYYDIKTIAIYDGEGSGDLKIYAGSYGAWDEIFNYSMRCEGWIYIDIEDLNGTVNTRYIRIDKSNPHNKIHEIVLYGDPTGDPIALEPLPEKDPGIVPTMSELIGYNSFAWYEAPEYVGSGGNIRLYWTVSDLFGSDGEGKINFAKHNLDNYFQIHTEAGINVTPCLQGGIPYVTNNNAETKPISEGASSTDPLSYQEHASMMFQFAARYGNTEVDESLLKLANGIEAKTGLGYLNYYENWNEQDGSWLSESTMGFSAEEFAAMCSADYDGHEGALGDGYGLKNADPDAKLVMGGTAGFYKDYVDGMAYWFKNNREDQKFVPDVINLHQYNGQQSPEATGIYTEWKEMIDYFNLNYPGKEIWLSEFGWDSYINEQGEKSPTAAPSEETQGQWLTRSYLLGSAAGFDQMQMYMIDDVDSTSTAKYATSGMLKRTDDRERKPSWYYISTTRNVLQNAVFQEVIKMDEVYILRYQDPEAKQDIYAIWSPTEDGTSFKDYAIEISGSNAMVTYMENRSTMGASEQLTVEDNKVSIDVTESPAFIIVSKETEAILAPVADLEPDTYNGHSTITLTAEDDTEIYYTIDYSTPTISSEKYTTPITLQNTATLKAIAVKNGQCSPVASYPYYVKQLALNVEDISVKDVVITPEFDKNTLEYWAYVANETESVEVTISAEDHIEVLINGQDVNKGQLVELPLTEGVNRFEILARQSQTLEEKTYLLYINRNTSRELKIISPVAAGAATGSGWCPMDHAFDGEVSLNIEYGRVEGTGGANSLPAYDGRTGYIDFGENWESIRIVSSWSLYQSFTTMDPVPFSTMWWDDDIDTINDSGFNETRLKFANAKGVSLGGEEKWFMDGQYMEEPVAPKGRYLMIAIQQGEGYRVRELAMVGYELSEDETENPSEPDPDIIKPASAGKVSDTNYSNFEAAFDGDVTYDKQAKTPVLTDAGQAPSLFTGRSVHIDFGENWENIRITEIWTYYRAWSSPNGIALETMRWSNNNSKSEDGIPENRLAIHTAEGYLGKEACWVRDIDYTTSPITPMDRYLIIDIPEGFSCRLSEIALVGYTVDE